MLSRGLLLGALALIAACGSDPTGPGVQPQIINAVDNFQYQVSNVASYTGTTDYTWTNNGTTATVNQSSAVSGGNASITIFDSQGTQVYSHPMSDNGTFSSSAGVAGSWKIRVSYASASGTMNFRADRAN